MGGSPMNQFIVVGAGFSGGTIARALADEGRTVLLIDKRSHVGGNAYDQYDAHGVLVHPYGPHIFHTNDERVFNFLSRFSAWRPYEHRVRSVVNGVAYPFPINRDTLNQLYGMHLDEAGAVSFLDSVRERRDPIRTSEDVVLTSVGRDLYETFFLNYTRKQWGMEPSQLKAGVAARIPVRTNTDDRYFTDRFQYMPRDGYTKLFQSMLDHPNIELRLGVDFLKERKALLDRFSHSEPSDQTPRIVYTGPIDAYFGYRLGRLPYRSLRFEHEHLIDVNRYQEVGTFNFPNEHDYTRITEFKHLTGQTHPGTSIAHEYPRAEGEPYYPVPTAENEVLFQRYQVLASKEKGVTFIGRLAEYRYYNMDQAAATALATADELIDRGR
jgi:UDP-galactopyranose mutase